MELSNQVYMLKNITTQSEFLFCQWAPEPKTA